MADPVTTNDVGQVPATANGAENDDDQFPPQEVLDDWTWLFDEYESGRLEPYHRQYVAVYQKKVLGGSDDPEQLCQDLGRQYGVDPNRFAVMFVGGWNDW